MTIEIDHLGIAVRSLAEGLTFYTGLLGMEVSAREAVPAEKVEVAMLPTGPASAPRIELLEASNADSTIAKFIAKRGPGLHHVALRVENLTAILDTLQAAGVELLSEPRTGAGGHRYVFIRPADTGGVLVELIQK